MNFRKSFLAAAALVASVGLAMATQTINDNLVVNGSISANSLGNNGTSISPRNVNVGGVAAVLAADGNDSTPVATEVYIGELYMPSTMTVTGLACFNGSVASGNMKVGLADASGNIIATSASTAMSGTDAYQRVAFTSTLSLAGPATYYALQFFDNGTARYNTFAVGKFGASKQTGQTYATGFTAITAPTTFTTALAGICGLY